MNSVYVMIIMNKVGNFFDSYSHTSALTRGPAGRTGTDGRRGFLTICRLARLRYVPGRPFPASMGNASGTSGSALPSTGPTFSRSHGLLIGLTVSKAKSPGGSVAVREIGLHPWTSGTGCNSTSTSLAV